MIELERHAVFSGFPRSVQNLSDGSELWTYTACVENQEDVECRSYRVFGTVQTKCRGGEVNRYCCRHQFFLRGGVVEEYRPLGSCRTSCARRPPSHPCTAVDADGV